MSIRTTAVTIAARCDGRHCYRDATATGPTLADARKHLRNQGWTILTKPYEATYCQPCAGERSRLVRNGILSRDGFVLDAAAYDRWLDQSDAAAGF